MKTGKDKIVATIGPAAKIPPPLCNDKSRMDVARLNFSHERSAEHQLRIATSRSLSNSLEKTVPFCKTVKAQNYA
jgi:pyruvate kinase